jgi:PIG-X / PBN1
MLAEELVLWTAGELAQGCTFASPRKGPVLLGVASDESDTVLHHRTTAESTASSAALSAWQTGAEAALYVVPAQLATLARSALQSQQNWPAELLVQRGGSVQLVCRLPADTIELTTPEACAAMVQSSLQSSELIAAALAAAPWSRLDARVPLFSAEHASGAGLYLQLPLSDQAGTSAADADELQLLADLLARAAAAPADSFVLIKTTLNGSKQSVQRAVLGPLNNVAPSITGAAQLHEVAVQAGSKTEVHIHKQCTVDRATEQLQCIRAIDPKSKQARNAAVQSVHCSRPHWRGTLSFTAVKGGGLHRQVAVTVDARWLAELSNSSSSSSSSSGEQCVVTLVQQLPAGAYIDVDEARSRWDYKLSTGATAVQLITYKDEPIDVELPASASQPHTVALQVSVNSTSASSSSSSSSSVGSVDSEQQRQIHQRQLQERQLHIGLTWSVHLRYPSPLAANSTGAHAAVHVEQPAVYVQCKGDAAPAVVLFNRQQTSRSSDSSGSSIQLLVPAGRMSDRDIVVHGTAAAAAVGVSVLCWAMFGGQRKPKTHSNTSSGGNSSAAVKRKMTTPVETFVEHTSSTGSTAVSASSVQQRLSNSGRRRRSLRAD